MTKQQMLDFLISELSPSQDLPKTIDDKWRLFRSLVNIRKPEPISDAFLSVQDKLLVEMIAEKGITDIDELSPINNGIYLWRGDITTLKVDGVVNAANSQMLGCFSPCHSCIDNAIHTFAGVQLRLECAKIMAEQGHLEPTGQAKITSAYNLPSKYILHTVGPIISGRLRSEDKDLLSSCYRSCLKLAEKNGLESVAFCCISTGVFQFPNKDAAEIAAKTVSDFLANSNQIKRVIFNVFTQQDEHIYNRILGQC